MAAPNCDKLVVSRTRIGDLRMLRFTRDLGILKALKRVLEIVIIISRTRVTQVIKSDSTLRKKKSISPGLTYVEILVTGAEQILFLKYDDLSIACGSRCDTS